MKTTEKDAKKKISPPGPSRAEVEHLCVLSVLTERGHSREELATAVGLDPALAPCIGQAIATLTALGAAVVREGRVFATEAGRTWLGTRLLEWELAAR